MPRKARSLNLLLVLARKLAGLTQVKLSKKTGILQPHISDIERKKRTVGLNKLRLISRATKCSFWIRSRGASLLDAEETKEVEEWLDEPEDWGIE